MENDKRYNWIKNRMCKALEMPVLEFDSYFSDKSNQELLKKFFSSHHSEGHSLYFGYVKAIEEVEGKFISIYIKLFL